MITPVILAGGSGTRLWPLSRGLHPKQFFSLWNDRSLLQNTVDRVAGLADSGDPLVLCNENHRFMVAEQLLALGVRPSAILLEPVARNTAPALAAAAHLLVGQGSDPILLVLPSDHFIRDAERFRSVVKTGAGYADRGYLITFGIVPQGPETGYGYIRKGPPIADGTENEAVAVDRFVEKPDLETARSYLETGRYCWNSGMFMFKASHLLSELEVHSPLISQACRQAVDRGRSDLDFFRLDPESFRDCPSDSIDYAVMEKTTRAAMLTLDAGWDDVGSWEALWQVGEKDADRNILRGDVLVHDVRDSYLHAGSRLVAAVGLKNHVVVETADAVMIAPRKRTQEVKKLVENLRARGRPEVDVHRKRYRPWGILERILEDDRFRVNRLTIRPGAGITRQKHLHRSEHWIVVAGAARVTRGADEFVVRCDESTFIPAGVLHRIENPGRMALEVIEVQAGGLLAESDTIRPADDGPGHPTR